MAKGALPRHIGFIPDGNRRWARSRGLLPQAGYERGIAPGLVLLDTCMALGIPEISVYGFTQENTHRPSPQIAAFRAACVAWAEAARARGAALLVVGDGKGQQFPPELRPYLDRSEGSMRVNLLVNYGWSWDLEGLKEAGRLRSEGASRIDLIVRWGGGRRLSGFLPVQSVYADFYVVDALWPDFRPDHFADALAWYRRQDRTLGG